MIFRVTEIFSWLLEVANDTRENWDGGKIIWSVSYVYDGPKIRDSIESTNQTPEESRRKLIAKVEINKDDIQAVLPISKVLFQNIHHISVLILPFFRIAII